MQLQFLLVLQEKRAKKTACNFRLACVGFFVAILSSAIKHGVKSAPNGDERALKHDEKHTKLSWTGVFDGFDAFHTPPKLFKNSKKIQKKIFKKLRKYQNIGRKTPQTQRPARAVFASNDRDTDG